MAFIGGIKLLKSGPIIGSRRKSPVTICVSLKLKPCTRIGELLTGTTVVFGLTNTHETSKYVMIAVN